MQFFADAITEMKRCLYRLPNAPYARATQDKLYQLVGDVKTAKIRIMINDRTPD